MKLPLVGKGRFEIIEGLVGLYQLVRTTKTPVTVTIEGPSGWGKTRLVQEFYERLASTQSQSYWAEQLSPPGSKKAVEDERKCLIPTAEQRSAKSLPDFMWIGMDCAHKSLAHDPILHITSQLETHEVFIKSKVNQCQGSSFSRKSLTERLKKVGQSISEDVASASIGFAAQALGGSMPFGGSMINLIKSTTANVTRAREDNKRISQAGLSNIVSERIDDILNELKVNFSSGLPLIIAIEDFHLRASTVDHFLNRLVELDIHALIIATGSGGPFDDNQKQPWHEVNHRIRWNSPTPKIFGESSSLDLTRDDIVSLVRDTATVSDTDLYQDIVDKFDTPLTYAINLEQHFELMGKEEPLTKEDVEAFAETTKDYYLKRWDELPVALKKELTLATLLVGGSSLTWNSNVVNLVANSGQDADQTPLRANNINEWVENISNSYKRFVSYEKYIVALSSRDKLLRRQLSHYKAEILQHLTTNQASELNIHSFENDCETALSIAILTSEMDRQECDAGLISLVSFFVQGTCFALEQDKSRQLPMFNALAYQGEYLKQVEVAIEELLYSWKTLDSAGSISEYAFLAERVDAYFQAHAACGTYDKTHAQDEILFLMSGGIEDNPVIDLQIARRVTLGNLFYSLDESFTFGTCLKCTLLLDTYDCVIDFGGKTLSPVDCYWYSVTSELLSSRHVGKLPLLLKIKEECITKLNTIAK